MKVGSLVIYKAQVALVCEIEDGKIWIDSADTVLPKKKVREKDVVLLTEGPITKLTDVLNAEIPTVDFSVASEFFSGTTSFEEIVSLFYGKLLPAQMWKAWLAISTSQYFKAPAFGAPILVLSDAEIELQKQKEQEKQNENIRYQEFLSDIQKVLTKKSDTSIIDTGKYAKFIQEIEQVALGKLTKSRVLTDIKKKQQAETAHELLLTLNIWNSAKNPYLTRAHLSGSDARGIVDKPQFQKNFKDLTHLTSYAIDNPGSSDPDDAVCFDNGILYIHVACPAETILPDSSLDEEACDRGASIYLPENIVRMLPESATEYFALLSPQCYALTFAIDFDEHFAPRDISIFRSRISVMRLTYKEADAHKDDFLKSLFDLAKKLFERRMQNGAISIEFPEVQIRVENKTNIILEPAKQFESSKVIREMMLIAGEAGALFAFKNQIPFQYISQEQASIPHKLPEGLAGEYQKRKHMRTRTMSTVPSRHFGLGLSMYAQVTSPLRRYGDLISQQQILHFIDKEPLIDKDTFLQKLSRAELSVRTLNQVMRLSKTHWILVYMNEHIEKSYEAVILDIFDRKAHIMILELAFETDMSLKTNRTVNEHIFVRVQSLSIPFQQCVCVEV